MLRHVLSDAICVLQELDVAQLVDLVVTDGLHAHACLDVRDILRACCHSRDASARKRDLGSRTELEVAIWVSSFNTSIGDIEQLILISHIVIEVMNGVSIIPEDAEIVRCGGHGCQLAHDLIAIRNTAWIGILRHAPDALHRSIIRYEFLDHVHVRAIFVHGNRDHLDAECLGHAEVAIVARNGAEELHFFKLAPGSCAQRAEHPAAHDSVIHDVQARVAEHDHVLRVIIKHRSHEHLRFLDAVQDAVIAQVSASFINTFGGRRNDIEHGHAQIQLVFRGLAASHIERKVERAIFVVFLLQRILERQEFVSRHFFVGGHTFSFRIASHMRNLTV